MSKVIYLSVFLSFLFAFPVDADVVWQGSRTRVWTSADGQHKTVAKLVDVSPDGKTVTLEQTDGKNTDVALEELSQEDQELVRKILRVVWLGSGVRTWTSANGRHKIEAKLVDVSLDGKTVTLEQTYGKNTDVVLEKLSQEDQEFIRRRQSDLLSVSRNGETVTLRSVDGKRNDFPLTVLTKKSQERVHEAERERKEQALERWKEQTEFRHEKQEELRQERDETLMAIIRIREDEGRLKPWLKAKIEHLMAKRSQLEANQVLREQIAIDKIEAKVSAEKEPDANKSGTLTYQSSFRDIFEAVTAGTIQDVKFFIEKGSSVNARNDEGRTLLHQAVFIENLTIARFLVDQGATINAKSDDGNTPLHEAVLDENLDMVKLLVSQGADVNAKNNAGETPLHVAAFGENVEIVRFLVFQKADVRAQNNDGKTPLDFAASAGNDVVIKYLANLK